MKRIKKLFYPIFLPVKFKRFYKEFRDKKFTMLDVGCGNHSPKNSKYWFPKIEYYGLDKQIYNNDIDDFKIMKKYYKINLEKIKMLKEIPDSFFDVIILSHIREYVQNGLEVIANIT